jgi:peptide/nickel transport system permease protein
LTLPAITLGSYTAARIARLTRSELLEVLGQDFIRTARSKGLWERAVVIKHAFRNAMVPVVTVVALELGTVLGGAVITETIFAWPGVARLMVQSIYERDFPVVQAGVFLIGATLVILNLVVDVLYAYLDPRIRYS